jgi:hypothetical protein
MTQYQMKLQQKAAERPRSVLELQMQQSQAEYERARMERAMAQVTTHAPLYGSGMVNQIGTLPGRPYQEIAENSTPLAQAPQRQRAKAKKSAVLKMKVWAYSKLSGASPFNVYRQLKREDRKNA